MKPNYSNIKPLRDFCLVKPHIPGESKTTSGIIITPHSDKVNATEGEVMAIGSIVKSIKIGDIVLFSHRIRTVLNENLGSGDNRAIFFVKEEDIQATRR